MSDAEFEKITNRAGSGAPNFTYGLNSGGADSGLIGFAYTSSGTEPSSPENGDVWFDTANDKYFTYINGEFKQLTHNNAQRPWYGARGLYAGGATASQNQIEYISVNISANATDFGDLSVQRGQTGAASNGTRAVWVGGYEYGNSARSEVMDYVTIASTGNATDFGNLTAATSSLFHSVVGDGTYGYRMGGIINPAVNVIDRWVQEIPANAVDHGDLTIATAYVAAACNGTVIVCAGGYIASSPYRTDTINTFTVGSGSNGTDFGNLTVGRQSAGTGYDLTRAVYAGGYAASGNSNVIDYVTMATPSNATDFGDLTTGEYVAATTDATLCCFGGGTGLGANIHKITIQTLGNAADTGYDLLTSYSNGAGGTSGAAS
jgi:hypothetical protein